MTGDVELPPLDADPDEWDDKWDEPTTITVDRWVKARLDHQRDNQPWNEYLESLRASKADPVTLSDAQAIAEYLEEQLGLTNQPVLDRLDDLEAQLPRKVAEELAR